MRRKRPYERLHTVAEADRAGRFLVAGVIVLHIAISSAAEVLHGWPMVGVWWAGDLAIVWFTVLIEILNARRRRWGHA